MSPLGQALVRKVFSVYLALAVGLTMLQVSLDYRAVYDQVLDELDSTIRSFEPGVADAIWNYQGDLVESIAKGMINGRVIIATDIRDASGRISVRAGDKGRLEKLDIVKRIPLFHATRKGGREQIGFMTLYSSHGIIIDRVKFSVMLIVLNSLLKTIGLWLIIVYFADRMLAKPLHRFTEQMGKFDPSRDMPATRIDLGPVQSTELTTLQAGFNALMARTIAYQQQLQQLTVTLEERVMQRTCELSKRNREILALYNNASCGYHQLDDKGYFVQINDTELQWLGYSRDQLLSGTACFADVVAPASLAAFFERMPDIARDGWVHDIHDAEFDMIRSDGTVFPVLISAVAIEDKAGGRVTSRFTVFDITELKEAQKKQLASERLLRSVTDHLPALVCYIDREHRFRFVNRAYEAWYRRPLSEITGKSLREILGGAHYQEWRSYLDLALQGMPVEFEFDMQRDGGVHNFKSILVPQFDERGGINGICGLCNDVTGMKEISEEYRRQKLEAEHANASKSRFLAAASHDLRQPLHALGLLTTNLKSASNESLREAILGQIERVLEGMDSEFHALLDVSKLDAGIIRPEPCNFAINDLLDAIITEYGGQATARGLRLAVRRSRLIVHSDPVLMGQVLRNLVSNAIKHSDSGHITVGCRRNDDNHCTLMVIDTGPGIPEHEQENVFQEFYQLKNPYHDRGKGLGLGLAIVRRITRLLGCELAMHSWVGRGTIFQVCLPISREASTQRIAAKVADLSNAVFSGRFVAVLDDDRYIVENTTRLLEGWGCAVVSAGAYRDLEAALGRQSRQPDLVLFDYTTCDQENGVELAQRLQQKYLERPLPVLILTGETSPEKLAELRASGFHLLTKPVRPARLRVVIGRIFEESDLPVQPT